VCFRDTKIWRKPITTHQLSIYWWLFLLTTRPYSRVLPWDLWQPIDLLFMFYFLHWFTVDSTIAMTYFLASKHDKLHDYTWFPLTGWCSPSLSALSFANVSSHAQDSSLAGFALANYIQPQFRPTSVNTCIACTNIPDTSRCSFCRLFPVVCSLNIQDNKLLTSRS